MKNLLRYIIVLFAAVNSFAQSGTLDLSFDPGAGANGNVFCTAIQADGKILIGGDFTAYNGTPVCAIARLNSNGTLDPSFNTSLLPAVGFPQVFAIAIRLDGGITIGGNFPDFGWPYRANLLNVDINGNVGFGFNSGFEPSGAVRTITRMLDGRFIVGGEFYDFGSSLKLLDIQCNNPSGGSVVTGGPVYSSAIQSDGKIIIGGNFTQVSGVNKVRVARLLADGTLDVNFFVNAGANGVVRTVAAQPDGKILIGGNFTTWKGTLRTRLARLLTNGDLDLSFNPSAGPNSEVLSMALQPDGKIIIGGMFSAYNGIGRKGIARIKVDGTIDASFNSGTGLNTSPVWSIALQTDEKIIIGGSFSSYNGIVRNNVARLNGDPPGAALNFDGVNDYIVTGSSPALGMTNTATVEGWFSSTSVAQMEVIRLFGAGDRGIDAGITGGKFYFNAFQGILVGTTWSSGPNLNDGLWHHFAVVSSGNNASAYVDGVFVGVFSGTGPLNTGTTNLYIGVNSTSTLYFNGAIDEIRVWNKALCQSEILNNKNCEIPTIQTGLVANYHFNQGRASKDNSVVTTLMDLSGNNITGTLNGFTLNGAISNWVYPGGVVSGSSCGIFNRAVTVASVSQTNISCNGGSNGTASVSASVGGGFTYDWTPGTPAGDGTPSVTGLSTGTYTCTVTNDCGGTGTQTFIITQPASIVTSAALQTNVSCFGGSNGAAAINIPTGGAGSYTYDWTSGNPTGDGTVSVTGLTAGTYTCTVTDSNSCTATQTFSITAPPVLSSSPDSQTNISCFSGSNGAASVSVTGGTTSYSYNWTPGNPTGDGTAGVTSLTAGTWTCTVTDANSCVTAQIFNITAPSALIASVAAQTNNLCNGSSNGAASITVSGGITSYSYNWAPGNPSGDGTASVTGLTSGTWTCTVTDGNLCTSSQLFTIAEPPAIVLAPVQSNVTCYGSSNGSAVVLASGGTGTYSYSWLPSGGTGPMATGLSAGTYTAIVSSPAGCTSTQSFIITEPPAIVLAPTQTNISCNGSSNGSAAVVASGGTGTYSYSWLPSGGTGSAAIGLGAGSYMVMVSSPAGCTTAQSFNITAPPLLIVSSISGEILCNGGSASISIVGSGGTSPYIGTGTYTQSAGTTSYTVTDAKGCSVTTSTTLTEPSVLSANASASSILCNGGVSTITVSATGGTPSYVGVGTYTAMAGTSSFTIADGNNCLTTTSVTISEPSVLSANTTASSILCNGAVSTITVSATGGTSPFSGVGTYTAMAGTSSFTITDGNNCLTTTSVTISQPLALVSSQTITLCEGQSIMIGSNTYTATGIYTDVFTAVNSCDSTVTTDLTVSSPSSISVNSGAICFGQSFTMTPIGASTYTFSNGNNIVLPTADATYTVNGTDANGCQALGAVSNVTVNATPTLITTTNNTLLCSGETSTLSVVGALTYTWSTTENTTNIEVTPTATTIYTVEGADVNGCMGALTITQDVQVCTGLVNFKGNETLINIYPNPNNGLFNIELNSISKVSVINAFGQLIISETMQEGKHNLDIQNQSDGVYFVKVIQNDKQYITKLIKD